MGYSTAEGRLRSREFSLKNYERFSDPVLEAEWGVKTTTSRDRIVFELIAFSGTSAKPDMFYIYRSTEARDKAVTEWLGRIRSAKIRKLESKVAKKAASESPNPAKVGDILCASWGYDQTNIDWYEVVEVVGKSTVKIREIGAKQIPGDHPWATGECSPVKGSFLDKAETLTRRVNKSKDGYSVKIESWGVWARFAPQGEEARRHWTAYA